MVNNPLLRLAISCGVWGGAPLASHECGDAETLRIWQWRLVGPYLERTGAVQNDLRRWTVFCWPMMWWCDVCVAHINGIDTYDGWLKCMMIVVGKCSIVPYMEHTGMMWCGVVVCVVFFLWWGNVQGEKGGMKSTKENQVWKEIGKEHTTIPRCSMGQGIFEPTLGLNLWDM